MGTLYVVGTPIGNLEDITLRAIRVLREVALIAAEDTRRARTLLTHYGIRTPLISYFEHSGAVKQESILSALERGDVALISEAGMPGLSDPGYDLIREVIGRGLPVVPVPGPSALVSALVVSGLATDSFVFVGFLPRRKSERQRALTALRNESRTLVFYEAPHRLLDSLQDILELLGDRSIAVARELTKLYEEVYRGETSCAIAHFRETGVRGEFTLVVQGADSDAEEAVCDAEQALALARRLLDAGLGAKEAAAEAARQTGRDRREIYLSLHRRGGETDLDR